MSGYPCPLCRLWFESASALLCDCENCVDGVDS